MLGESKLIAWLAWAEVAVCHSQSWGRTVLPLCHTQPRLPCLSLHTCQFAASTLDECQGEGHTSAFQTGHPPPAPAGAMWKQLLGRQSH